MKTSLDAEQRSRLQGLLKLVTGFLSELSLEVLASVDFVMQQHPGADLEGVTRAIAEWSKRKERLFRPEYISVAYQHLQAHEAVLGQGRMGAEL